MELSTHHGVTADDCGHGSPVIRFGDEIRALGRIELERVDEIGMQSLRPERDTVEQRVRPRGVEGIPTHMGYFQPGIIRRDPVHLPRYPDEIRRHLVFTAALGHELHAHADAEEWMSLHTHAGVERLYHSGDRIETASAIRESADAGQNHTIRTRDLLGIAGDNDRLLAAAFPCRALERLGG